MPICVNKRGDVFEELMEVSEEEMSSMKFEYPITHALVVAKSAEGFLLMFNKWKKNWEVAGGILEEGETLRECALRELREETNQIPSRLFFLGLMRFSLHNGKTEYGGLFSAFITEPRPFEENEEAGDIVFWDEVSDIGYIDEIDQKLLSFYRDEEQ
ncbi:hypothetical protein BK126_06920 [Paenibacillus sp. FSL H7-0326]|uniref:NUDIX domain-containing protein n=1 Tax=Paenibacillus sp. FSL H7-0326 TaxID=1921144 RepID=UPI00096F0AB6|nr:NUDIX domain-containing protein [Paenibacillus sp. FSL H7-0326]OMC71776.1 hypothetical protein BK126_06920 [Paenibacillus sp. FSL H7-0326]